MRVDKYRVDEKKRLAGKWLKRLNKLRKWKPRTLKGKIQKWSKVTYAKDMLGKAAGRASHLTAVYKRQHGDT
jgi:hypothetical protein